MIISGKSTSLHILNGDRNLKKGEQKLYYIFNRLNNLLPIAIPGRKIDIKNFRCDLKSSHNKFYPKESPSRRLSNLFWVHLPWGKIKQELGEIHIFDTGCGKGKYGERLSEWSSSNISSYTGVDITHFDEWKQLQRNHPHLTFCKGDHTQLNRLIRDDTNFFITQSALEHFEYDLLYFEQISAHLHSNQKNAIQVHLIPPPACLKLYGLHGIRQYTPRTVYKIMKIFMPYSYSVLYKLGGSACNQLHEEFITEPLRKGIGDLRDQQTEKYVKRLMSAIAYDMQMPSTSPAFYALIIHSYPKNKIF